MHAAAFDLFHLLPVIVDALAAGRHFKAAEEKVKTSVTAGFSLLSIA